jgi:hypothetical protein
VDVPCEFRVQISGGYIIVYTLCKYIECMERVNLVKKCGAYLGSFVNSNIPV